MVSHRTLLFGHDSSKITDANRARIWLYHYDLHDVRPATGIQSDGHVLLHFRADRSHIGKFGRFDFGTIESHCKLSIVFIKKKRVFQMTLMKQ